MKQEQYWLIYINNDVKHAYAREGGLAQLIEQDMWVL